MNRFVKVGLLALVGVLILIVVAVHLWLGTLIRAGVERVGPNVTGSSVTLKDVDISLLAGRAELKDLMVGNPRGFHAPTALKIGAARVQVKWDTVLSNPVVIEEIMITGPEVTYEGILSKSNFSTILDNARSFASASTGQKPKAGGPLPPAGPSAEKKFLIRELNVTNGRVALWVSSGALENQNLSVALPDIHLKDIGKDSGGATVAEAVSAVLAALNKASVQAVASSTKPLEQGAKAAEELLRQGGSKAEESLKGLFK